MRKKPDLRVSNVVTIQYAHDQIGASIQVREEGEKNAPLSLSPLSILSHSYTLYKRSKLFVLREEQRTILSKP